MKMPKDSHRVDHPDAQGRGTGSALGLWPHEYMRLVPAAAGDEPDSTGSAAAKASSTPGAGPATAAESQWPARKLLRLEEAAELLGLVGLAKHPVKMVLKMAQRGDLQLVTIGKHKRIDPASIERYLNGGESAARGSHHGNDGHR